MLLAALEDAALDCVDELTAPADDETEAVRSLPTALFAYAREEDYERHSSWARTLPLSTYQACVGHAYQLLADDGIPVEIVSPYD